MTLEGATVPAMSDDPTTMAGHPVLERVRAQLIARGLDPDALPAVEADSRETPEQAAERKGLQSQHKRARWAARLPLMYADASLDDLDDSQHHHALVEWCRLHGPRTLILAGGIGAGKTHAAYAVGNDAVKAGLWVEAWRVHDLLQALRPDGERWAQDNAQRCHLLVLDDLGATKVTAFAVDALTAILDARLNNRLPTVVTTNATQAQLTEAWGERLLDRLRYRRTALEFRGQSRRTQDAW